MLSLSLAAGSGFHSNDARGLLSRIAPADPFARAIGYEVGARFVLEDRLELTATGYVLDLESEVVWVGDEGTTEPSGRTRRVGTELTARATLIEWLESDLAFQWSRGRFRDSADGEDLIPLAPIYLMTAGLSVIHPAGFSGRLGLTWVGDRPATEDGFLEAEGFVRLDFAAEYEHPRFGLGLQIQNLTNTDYRTAQFATTSRLEDEAGPSACPGGTRAVGSGAAFEGCEDISLTPGWPTTILGSASLYF
jgi:outer membrane receptor protein involved in Fe transport